MLLDDMQARPISSWRWLKVGIAFVSASCLILLYTTDLDRLSTKFEKPCGEQCRNNLFDKLVDKLVDRTLKVWSLHHADLDNTTLGKRPHLALPPSTGSLYSRPQVSNGGVACFHQRRPGLPRGCTIFCATRHDDDARLQSATVQFCRRHVSLAAMLGLFVVAVVKPSPAVEKEKGDNSGRKKRMTNKASTKAHSRSLVSSLSCLPSLPSLPFFSSWTKVLRNLGPSAFSAAFAEVCTIPIDTAKVRLQLQGNAIDTVPKYKGILRTMRTIAREEGLGALWKGLTAGIHRQILFGGLSIGLYEPVKNYYGRFDFLGDVPLLLKIMAGLTTGAIAIGVASPTDLVKVRLQVEDNLQTGAGKRYPNAVAAYSIIAKDEGFLGLWTGVTPNIVRCSIINAAEMASYDQAKQVLLAAGLKDDILCQILSGLGAGLMAVCVGSPVDTVKSQVMGDSQGLYKGFFDCCYKTMVNKGPLAFYQGFLSNFGRLGSFNVVVFVTLEQLRKALRDF